MVGSCLLQTDRGSGQADFGQPGAQSVLTGDERRSSGRAALLAVAVGKTHAFLGDAVDVGRAVAHQPVAVAAQIGNADIITPDDDDVRLGCCSGSSHFDLLSLVGWFRKCSLVSVARASRLREAEQHGKEGEKTDADEENGDRHDRRLHPLLGDAGDRRERFAPQITKAPPVLPNRNDERQDAARDQRQPQIFRRGWKISGAGSGRSVASG